MKTKKIKLGLICLTLLFFSYGNESWAYPKSIISNHKCTKLSNISHKWINQAKKSLHIAYGHTSHGSQLVSGMHALIDEKGDLFDFDEGGGSDTLDFHDRAFSGKRHDLGHKGDTRWARLTREYLDDFDNSKCNVVIWSWCGGCSGNTKAGINKYLKTMNKLEKDYPHVMFVYMTGHLDGSGKRGKLHINNERIRKYCKRNKKILYDFADIESYDPDGKYYLNKGANDRCDYKGGNWAKEWCRKHPDKCWYNGKCAHSHSLNCQMKGIAAWWLWAELAKLKKGKYKKK